MKLSILIVLSILSVSCLKTTHQSPLDININEIQSVKIIDVISYFQNDSLIKKDTIIPIAKKHWDSLVDNFNNAVSWSVVKSIQRYEIIITLINQKQFRIRCSSNKDFKINKDWGYKFTKENSKILDTYYTLEPIFIK